MRATLAGCDRRGRGHFPLVDFEDLYRATYPRVLAYARSVASREDADDAVAETYAIAWRRQRSIPRGAELGWLIGVTRRVLANARRGRRRAGALHALLDLQPRVPAPIRPTGSPTASCAWRCWSCRRWIARRSC